MTPKPSHSSSILSRTKPRSPRPKAAYMSCTVRRFCSALMSISCLRGRTCPSQKQDDRRRARAHRQDCLSLERCRKLALPVSFVRADAADVELDGSVFFLYAPFNGEMLTRVLRRLEDGARRRAIVVCAVGLEFREVPWLLPRRTSSVALAVYDSSLVYGVPGRSRGSTSSIRPS